MAIPVESKGIFDGRHPPSTELMDACVHCGFCLPACPTYVLWGEEADSPRGRIYLMRLGTEGRVEMSDAFVGHIDQCLGCMACVTACPSGVQYEKLIESTRSQIERNYKRSAAERFLRKLIFAVFPKPGRLRALSIPLWIYQRSGLQWLAHSTGLIRLLPASFRGMEAMLPPLKLEGIFGSLSALIPASGAARGRVGLLLGCVQRVFFSEVNSATARVLAAEGFEVVIPRGQGCCGALPIHAGQEEQALSFARVMIDEFERAKVDTIVINAAGCGSTLKEYGYLLRDDPVYRERAFRFSEKCKDISEVIAGLEPRAPRHPLPLKLAFQDACHLQHAQGIRAQPRDALKRIPGLEVVEIDEGSLCCGSAGIYNLVEPETARQLGDRKVKNILAAAPDAVASSNPGCLLQIKSGLQRAGCDVPALHFVEVIDASMRNVPPAELLGRR
jgi:glycolate oxidase iron-sulfur subunit